jgi:hypothetical protein
MLEVCFILLHFAIDALIFDGFGFWDYFLAIVA